MQGAATGTGVGRPGAPPGEGAAGMGAGAGVAPTAGKDGVKDGTVVSVGKPQVLGWG